MSGRVTDDGLSEVIGFILIIAVLVVIASLYVAYVVPAQGREAEIEHMTYVKNQFVDFKMALDSLWINQQTNVDLSQNIEMGTLGQKTEGQFVFIPLANPIGSDGMMSVNTNESSGKASITINGLFRNISDEESSFITVGEGSSSIIINPDIFRQMQYYEALYPSQTINIIRIPVNDPAIPSDPNDFTGLNPDSKKIYYHLLTVYPNSSISSGIQNWTADFYLNRVPSFDIQNSVSAQSFKDTEKWAGHLNATFRYDLIMNLMKRNQSFNYPVLQNFTINSSFIKPNEFWINLQDPAYGLDTYGPVIMRDDAGNWYNGTLNQTQNYDVNITQAFNLTQKINYSLISEVTKESYKEGEQSSSTDMGSFSYIGKNYYWLNQEYTYVMGGIFLSQEGTGGSVAKVMPLISLGVRDGEPEVKITRLQITGNPSVIAGSSGVQVISRVTGIRKNYINNKLLAPSPDNARNVSISIEYSANPEMVQAWQNAFQTAVYSANLTTGFDPSWSYIPPSTNTKTEIHIQKTPMNISLDYTEVDAEIILQPVGWQGS